MMLMHGRGKYADGNNRRARHYNTAAIASAVCALVLIASQEYLLGVLCSSSATFYQMHSEKNFAACRAS